MASISGIDPTRVLELTSNVDQLSSNMRNILNNDIGGRVLNSLQDAMAGLAAERVQQVVSKDAAIFEQMISEVTSKIRGNIDKDLASTEKTDANLAG